MNDDASDFKKFLHTRAGKWMIGIAAFFVLVLIGSLFGDKKPTLAITKPIGSITTLDKVITVAGHVKPKKSEVRINGKLAANSNGEFTQDFQLPNEQNSIKIVATNGTQTSEVMLNVTRTLSADEKVAEEKAKAEVAAQQKAAEEAAQAKTQADQAAYDKTPAGKACKGHPSWTKEDCQQLADKKIWVGMGYDMVVYLRGKPNTINPSNYGSGTEYQYCWDNYTPSCFYDNNGDGTIDAYN